MKKVTDNDAYGKGLLAYYKGRRNAKFTIFSDLAETEKWEIATFFRKFRDMPEQEQIALRNSTGRVLDAGAGAGSHALWLEEQQLETVAIDISEGAVEVMKERGVKDARQIDFFRLKNEKFDTILLLMNGAGIIQRLDNFKQFFAQARQLLNTGGKILMDSSDILYMFEDEEEGGALINLNAAYYGEIEYRMDFGSYRGVPFDWIFIDFNLLADLAEQNGFTCTKLHEDDHYLYLAELKVK